MSKIKQSIDQVKPQVQVKRSMKRNLTRESRIMGVAGSSVRSISAIVTILVAALIVPIPSQASSSLLPQTTSWTGLGLNEMFRVSGKVAVSVDGVNLLDAQTGTIQVEKPSNDATVLGAYLTLAAMPGHYTSTAPTGVRLNYNQTVTFTHSARARTPNLGFSGNFWEWANFLADVTSLVKPGIDNASSGVINVPIGEGADYGKINGTSLIVIFDVGTGGDNTVIFMFGTTDPAGSTTTSNFSALGGSQLSGHFLSLGVSYSGQFDDFVQSSSIDLTSSSRQGPARLTSIAGGANDGQLFTVGGVGDSTSNPQGAVWGTHTDDELYDISSFLASGDTSLAISSRNASGDDNLFQAIIYLKGVAAQGAAPVSAQSSNATVTFDSNGGSGSLANQTASSGANLTPLNNSITLSGFTFSGWNTAADGSGTAYGDGASFPFTSNTTLYAQWTAITPSTPRSVPYEGPLNLRNQSGTLCSGGEGILSGDRLNTITEIYVGDKKVAQELLPDGRLKYSLKDIAPGTYQIRYWVPVNSVNLTDQIRVGTCSTAPVATAPGAFEASRLFANYRGDRGPVIARDRAAITAFINQYKGITSVKCVGSTSGVPAKRTDPALAQARAKNACDIVKTLVPNATYTLETSTGKGVGQRFRSVTIFISGTT